MSALDFLNNHELTIWRPDAETLNADGTPGAETWSAVATGVACQFQPGQSQFQPTEFVLGETDNLFTFDPVFTAQGTDIQVGDVLQQTSGPQAGKFWIVRGNSQVNDLLENQSNLCSRLDAPPEWYS